MNWVLDSSVALAWALPDEHSKEAEQFLTQTSAGDDFWVPALWWYEISNALVTAQHRRRIKEAERLQIIDLFYLLPLQVDTHFQSEPMRRLQELALAYSLSVYDAAYLDLALHKGLALATFDRRLQHAAVKSGIEIPFSF
jgi:predicted nucleic acid-binding protein